MLASYIERARLASTRWSALECAQVSSDESARLIKMEETLHNRVIGQEEAVVAISRAIRRARVGLKSPNRPIASFIFSGAPALPFSTRCEFQTFSNATLCSGDCCPADEAAWPWRAAAYCD